MNNPGLKLPATPETGRGRSSFAFTVIELLVVISIIGLISALGVGMLGRAKRARVESQIRAELQELQTAIESYQAALGYYPADNPRNPAQNPLFYELSGTIVDNANATFRTVDDSEVVPAAAVRQQFGVEGFANAAVLGTDPKQVRRFFKPDPRQYGEISRTPDVEVLLVPQRWPLNPRPELAAPTPVPGLNPWRYVSTNPTNNRTSFDLWAEYVDGNKVKIIGNWTKEVLDKP